MKLPISAKAKEIEIKSPKWITREVYIATYKVADEHNIIIFTDEKARKEFPDKYYIEGQNIRKYPIFDMPTKTGATIRVYRVSLDELILYEGRTTKK